MDINRRSLLSSLVTAVVGVPLVTSSNNVGAVTSMTLCSGGSGYIDIGFFYCPYIPLELSKKMEIVCGDDNGNEEDED